MTKEARISKSETARQDLLAFHLNFGFRYSFDIRHSDFVIIQSDGKGIRAGPEVGAPSPGTRRGVSLSEFLCLPSGALNMDLPVAADGSEVEDEQQVAHGHGQWHKRGSLKTQAPP